MKAFCVFTVVLSLCLVVGMGLMALPKVMDCDGAAPGWQRLYCMMSGIVWLTASVILSVICAAEPWKDCAESWKASEKHWRDKAADFESRALAAEESLKTVQKQSE